MKIGIDCRLWNETGVGRYIRNLIKELQIIDKRNEYVLFVLNKDYNQVNSQLSTLNSQLVKADIRWHTLEEQIKFPQILNREDLDLMHFPYFSVPIFYNKPFVVTIHDLIFHHFPTAKASALPPFLYKLKLLGYRFVISQAAKKAKRIITVSKATKDEIVDHLKVSEDKVVVTYEGVDSKIINSKLQIQNKYQKLKFKIERNQYFLYVGNAYPHKNLERLAIAFTYLKFRLLNPESNIRLVLVGESDYFYRMLKVRLRQRNLIDFIIFYGHADDWELAGLYRNALAMVIPSVMEGFGLPALEAMANKCLVLASNIPSLKEVCGDAAIYFDPYDPIILGNKMREVYYNDTYHYSDNINKGFERAKMFSWQKMAQETLKVYKSCLDR